MAAKDAYDPVVLRHNGRGYLTYWVKRAGDHLVRNYPEEILTQAIQYTLTQVPDMVEQAELGMLMKAEDGDYQAWGLSSLQEICESLLQPQQEDESNTTPQEEYEAEGETADSQYCYEEEQEGSGTNSDHENERFESPTGGEDQRVEGNEPTGPLQVPTPDLGEMSIKPKVIVKKADPKPKPPQKPSDKQSTNPTPPKITEPAPRNPPANPIIHQSQKGTVSYVGPLPTAPKKQGKSEQLVKAKRSDRTPVKAPSAPNQVHSQRLDYTSAEFQPRPMIHDSKVIKKNKSEYERALEKHPDLPSQPARTPGLATHFRPDYVASIVKVSPQINNIGYDRLKREDPDEAWEILDRLVAEFIQEKFDVRGGCPEAQEKKKKLDKDCKHKEILNAITTLEQKLLEKIGSDTQSIAGSVAPASAQTRTAEAISNQQTFYQQRSDYVKTTGMEVSSPVALPQMSPGLMGSNMATNQLGFPMTSQSHFPSPQPMQPSAMMSYQGMQNMSAQSNMGQMMPNYGYMPSTFGQGFPGPMNAMQGHQIAPQVPRKGPITM